MFQVSVSQAFLGTHCQQCQRRASSAIACRFRFQATGSDAHALSASLSVPRLASTIAARSGQAHAVPAGNCMYLPAEATGGARQES